jgi:hypothetical protein
MDSFTEPRPNFEVGKAGTSYASSVKREKFGGKDDDVEQNLQTADSNGVGGWCDAGAGDADDGERT